MLNGKFLEVLWDVLRKVLWELGVLRQVLSRVLRGIGGREHLLETAVVWNQLLSWSTLTFPFYFNLRLLGGHAH